MKTEPIDDSDLKQIKRGILGRSLVLLLIFGSFVLFLLFWVELLGQGQAIIQTVKMVFLTLIELLIIYGIYTIIKEVTLWLKDLKNGLKYCFESVVKEKDLEHGDYETESTYYIKTKTEEYNPIEVKVAFFKTIEKGNKVYFEVLPISKKLLKIKKI